MRILLLLLLCAPAWAGFTLPLGPYARPGVPVLMGGRGVVEADGWEFRVEDASLVHPPRVPCRVGGHDLEAVPDGALLVGVVGAEMAAPHEVRTVPIRLGRLRPEHWRALDLFDRIVLAEGAEVPEAAMEAITLWVRAGGSLVAPGWSLADRGLGEVFSAPGLEASLREAGPVRPLLIPRPGNVRPDVYRLIRRPEEPSPALSAARWVVLGSAAVLALQLLLAAGRLISRRGAVVGIVLLALVGSVIGALRTGADYVPVASGRIVVSYASGRHRVYTAHTAMGPGAAVTPPADATPILFRSAGGPWWGGPDRECKLGSGVIRVFLTERQVPPPIPGGSRRPDHPVKELAPRERPLRGRWETRPWPGVPALEADPDGIPVLARLRFAPQR